MAKGIVLNKEEAISKVYKIAKENNQTVSDFEYNGSKTLLTIKCNICDRIWTKELYKYKGVCKSCSCRNGAKKKYTEKEAKSYIYNIAKENNQTIHNFEYKSLREKIEYSCNICGTSYSSLFSTYKGKCRKCYSNKIAENYYLSMHENIANKAKENNHTILYTLNYHNSHSEFLLKCNKCNSTFIVEYNNYVNKNSGCRKCSYKIISDKVKFSNEKKKSLVLKKCIEQNSTLLEFKPNSNFDFKIKIRCNKCNNIWNPYWYNYIKRGFECPSCLAKNGNVSNSEKEISEFINRYVITTNKSKYIISPYELDIFIPSKNIAIEFNGLYWHSNIDKNYHLNKTEMCEKLGIQLIHIFEDEWHNKKDIVKSRLLNLIGESKRIYARKCDIKEVSSKIANLFLEENHIQGKCNSKYRYGLYYNNELVSLMTFGATRKITNSIGKGFELIRFCNKLNYSVIGGAGKLLKHFEKTVYPTILISYADRRWSIGNLYEKLGFKFKHNSGPSYFYFVNRKREHRFKYRKNVLVSQGFDINKTEKTIMEERGIKRIYDCGTKVYIKEYN